MNVNTQAWGAPFTEYSGLNVRTGASDLTDTDFEDFPPFVRNSFDAESEIQYVPKGDLYYAYLADNDIINLNKPIERSIAYTACKNMDIPINQIWGYSCTPDSSASQYPELTDTSAIMLQSDNTPIPIVLLDTVGIGQARNHGMGANQHYFRNPFYRTSQGVFYQQHLWTQYAANADISGNQGTPYDNTGRGRSNKNLFAAYYRDFGVRSFFLQIRVIYYNSIGATSETPSGFNDKSLYWYSQQTAAWKEEHPLTGAYGRLIVRSSTTGVYQQGNNVNPDITINLKSNWSFGEVSIGDLIGQPIANVDTEYLQSAFPLFGVLAPNHWLTTETGTHTNGGVSQNVAILIGGGENSPIVHKQGKDGTQYKGTMWCEMEGTDENLELLRKWCAAYGLFFTDGDSGDTGYSQLYAAGNDETRWTDEKMCLGVIDDEGFTDGTYTRGPGNEDANNWDWKTASESKYDPSKPPVPPTPAITTDDILPVGLDWTLAGQGTNIYALNPSEIQRVWQDIFGSGVDVKQFGNQPMNAILSLKWTPFDWTYDGIQSEKPIILGVQEANPLHVYKVIEAPSRAQKHMSGILNFKFNKNFFNARYMQARLFLPFYGYYELPTAQLLSSDLQVDFFYNIPDELGVWFISYRQEGSSQWVIYDYCECAIDMEVPLTGSNAAQISASRKQEALTIATQIASAAATFAIGGSTVLGIGQAARHLAQGIDALADVGLGWGSAGVESEAYLGMRGAGTGWMAKAGSAAGAIGAGVGAAINIYNTINNAKIERAALRTNLPYHGSALQTTFLHLSMVPYVQIFKNNIMKPLSTTGNDITVELGGTEKLDYMLKVGHACDIWQTLDNMPANSLCQTTGIANMNTTGLELSEVQELNSILQSGFYKSIQ